MTRKLFYTALAFAVLATAPSFYMAGWMGREQTTDRVYTQEDLETSLMELAEYMDNRALAEKIDMLEQIDRQDVVLKDIQFKPTVIQIRVKRRVE